VFAVVSESRSSPLLFPLALFLLFTARWARVIYCGLPELSELGFDLHGVGRAVRLVDVPLRRQGTLVMLPQLSVHDRICQLEVSTRLLVALKHVHTAA